MYFNSTKNQIEFRNVTYAHTKDENKLFENMNLKFLNGEKVGIFGQSGSGKTTFLNLISGFIKPQSGKILLDNEDISISNNDLLDHVSYVSQNVFLFNDSIEYNIVLEKDSKKINFSLLEKIIEITELDKLFVHGKNIKSQLTELGSNLSGGQRQRIGIARALYKNGKIFIFDEPTSALDKESEINIIKNLKKEFLDKTLFIVTHREYILKYCTKIVYFENGSVRIVDNN